MWVPVTWEFGSPSRMTSADPSLSAPSGLMAVSTGAPSIVALTSTTSM